MWLKCCHSRLKSELEGATEKCIAAAEPTSEADVHQKIRDIKVKGAPGTKLESMKVLHYFFTVVIRRIILYIITLVVVDHLTRTETS